MEQDQIRLQKIAQYIDDLAPIPVSSGLNVLIDSDPVAVYAEDVHNNSRGSEWHAVALTDAMIAHVRAVSEHDDWTAYTQTPGAQRIEHRIDGQVRSISDVRAVRLVNAEGQLIRTGEHIWAGSWSIIFADGEQIPLPFDGNRMSTNQGERIMPIVEVLKSRLRTRT